MNGNTGRHSREDIFEALLEGRKALGKFLSVRSEEDILRSAEVSRIVFGLMRASAQKESDLGRNPGVDDIRMDELIPATVSATAAIQLRYGASIATMQDLLSADMIRVRSVLADENEYVRAFVLAMMPVTLVMSYAQFLSSLEATQQLFSSPRH